MRHAPHVKPLRSRTNTVASRAMRFSYAQTAREIRLDPRMQAPIDQTSETRADRYSAVSVAKAAPIETRADRYSAASVAKAAPIETRATARDATNIRDARGPIFRRVCRVGSSHRDTCKRLERRRARVIEEPVGSPRDPRNRMKRPI